MISHKHHCIFIHIPKCGGTSIEDVIWPDTRKVSDLWMGNISKYYNKYQTGGMQHLLAFYIRNEVGADVFDRYFKFTLVRNPWDKTISQYHHMRSRQDLREYIGMSKGDTLKKYLELIQKKNHVQWEHQYKFIYNDMGDVIVDCIGRFENYVNDVNKILSIIGLAGKTIPHKMKSHHKPYHEYYDDESVEIVRSLYEKDIKIFGYAFNK